MARWLLILTLTFAAVPCLLASPQEAIAAAVADVQKLPPAVAQQTRYLSIANIPADQRDSAKRVLAFVANSLSRESELVSPRQVTPDLLAVQLFDYGWDAKTWDKLADADPYFHVRVEIDELQAWGYHDAAGRWVQTRTEKTGRKVKKTASAPWLDAGQVAYLVGVTQSQAPVLRADWWAVQVLAQEDRVVGYYDFLFGFGQGKKKEDFDKFVGLDVKAAQRLRKEVAAIVPVSTVALHNRQIFRFQTITGTYWETRDAKQSTDKSNAIRLLNGDFQPQAFEVYGSLPNGLFAFYLADDKGNRANTAPDFIASDGKASGTDRRVHAGISCVRCHLPGIQPINDYARQLYRGQIQLQAIDPVKFVRLRQLYLSDLERHVRRDQEDYLEVVKRVNGLTPGLNAKAVANFWDRYVEVQVTRADAARELGVSELRLTNAVKAYAAKGLFDPVLAGFIQEPPLSLTRAHWEELQPIVWSVLENRR